MYNATKQTLSIEVDISHGVVRHVAVMIAQIADPINCIC
jgi:hypothetical protein